MHSYMLSMCLVLVRISQYFGWVCASSKRFIDGFIVNVWTKYCATTFLPSPLSSLCLHPNWFNIMQEEQRVRAQPDSISRNEFNSHVLKAARFGGFCLGALLSWGIDKFGRFHGRVWFWDWNYAGRNCFISLLWWQSWRGWPFRLLIDWRLHSPKCNASLSCRESWNIIKHHVQVVTVCVVHKLWFPCT